MYEYIRGTIAKVDDTSVVLDVGGIGYRLVASKTTLGEATHQIEKKNSHSAPTLCLYTEFVVREDSHTLYGFLSEQDRTLFRLLVSISGIGSKLALQIMNHGPAREVLRALSQRDIPWLSSISGIGKKTAERLAIETSERALELMTTLSSHGNHSQSSTQTSQILGQKAPEIRSSNSSPQFLAIQTLISLGLSEPEARQCVQDALQQAVHSENEEVLSDLSRLIQLSLVHRKKKQGVKTGGASLQKAYREKPSRGQEELE